MRHAPLVREVHSTLMNTKAGKNPNVHDRVISVWSSLLTVYGFIFSKILVIVSASIASMSTNLRDFTIFSVVVL